MSPTRKSPRITLSPAWALLLLFPAALAAGWLVGGLPVPVTTPSASTPEVLAGPGQAPVVAVVPAGRSGPASLFGSPSRSEPDAAREEPSSWTTLPDAIAQSERNGKPILIDFNAEWCGPCRRMKQEVFDGGALGRAVQVAVIPVSIVDRQAEDGSNPPEVESLQRRYQVNAFPTLVVFSPKTGRSLQTRGYGGPERTAAWIAQAAKSVR